MNDLDLGAAVSGITVSAATRRGRARPTTGMARRQRPSSVFLAALTFYERATEIDPATGHVLSVRFNALDCSPGRHLMRTATQGPPGPSISDV